MLSVDEISEVGVASGAVSGAGSAALLVSGLSPATGLSPSGVGSVAGSRTAASSGGETTPSPAGRGFVAASDDCGGEGASSGTSSAALLVFVSVSVSSTFVCVRAFFTASAIQLNRTSDGAAALKTIVNHLVLLRVTK